MLTHSLALLFESAGRPARWQRKACVERPAWRGPSIFCCCRCSPQAPPEAHSRVARCWSARRRPPRWAPAPSRWARRRPPRRDPPSRRSRSTPPCASSRPTATPRGSPACAAAAATARREAPDLLDASTYGSEAAAAYFKGVDGALAARGAAARPSVGHLCVADAKAAGAWGAAASVWPLGPAHYAWLPGSPTFWPAGGPPERAAADARLDEGLGDAIREGREVLFSCESNRFVAVPLALEGELRAGLDLLACKLTLGLG